jgi:hypothetical protein
VKVPNAVTAAATVAMVSELTAATATNTMVGSAVHIVADTLPRPNTLALTASFHVCG